MGLIIGGSVASATLLALIMIFALSGGNEEKPAKKDTTAPPVTNRDSGPKVDEALLNRGLMKCEKAYGLYRKLKGRMHNRSGLSESELNRLMKDLEDVDGKMKEGLRDIEFSNGFADATAFTKAHKDMKMVLMELK